MNVLIENDGVQINLIGPRNKVESYIQLLTGNRVISQQKAEDPNVEVDIFVNNLARYEKFVVDRSVADVAKKLTFHRIQHAAGTQYTVYTFNNSLHINTKSRSLPGFLYGKAFIGVRRDKTKIPNDRYFGLDAWRP